MNHTTITLPGETNYFMQEALNVLRTNIQFCGMDVKVIVVTSCEENEGKTTVSLHLGKKLAELGKRVLVLDADMRKSVMAGRYAQVRGTTGLSEVLTGQMKMTQCLYTTETKNLYLMFAGQYPPNPVELLNSKYFDRTLEAVSSVYDYVIIDAPPLGAVIDAAVIAAKCDSAILVIGNTHTRVSKAKSVLTQLKKSGCNVLGVVMNNIEKKGKVYYYKK